MSFIFKLLTSKKNKEKIRKKKIASIHEEKLNFGHFNQLLDTNYIYKVHYKNHWSQSDSCALEQNIWVNLW